jgi:hypothetical protein
MRSFRRVAPALAIALIWASTATPILAADNGTVDASVTVATPCLLVTPSSLDFGTLAFNSTASQPVTYTNCGITYERVYGKGTDATGTAATWTLNPTFGSCGPGSADQYGLYVATYSGATFTPVNLSTTDALLESVAPNSAGVGDQLFIRMPCAGSGGGGETMSFQVTYTATF